MYLDIHEKINAYKNKSYKQLYISYCTSLNMFFHYKIKNIDYLFHIKNPRFHTEIKTGILITRNFLKHLNFVVSVEDDTKTSLFLIILSCDVFYV